MPVASHTPGPWVCYADLPSTEPHWHIVTNASRMRVLANVHIEPGNAVDEANARLITAAPELLSNERKNPATMQVTRARLRDYGKSTAELDAAILQTEDAIARASLQSLQTKEA